LPVIYRGKPDDVPGRTPLGRGRVRRLLPALVTRRNPRSRARHPYEGDRGDRPDPHEARSKRPGDGAGTDLEVTRALAIQSEILPCGRRGARRTGRGHSARCTVTSIAGLVPETRVGPIGTATASDPQSLPDNARRGRGKEVARSSGRATGRARSAGNRPAPWSHHTPPGSWRIILGAAA
jgi:hypothetical protein